MDHSEMPRYRSHKEVWALRIAELAQQEDGSAVIKPTESGYAPFTVDAAYVTKHQPKVGGYYVVYADGYKSWSPAEAFDEGYSRVN